MSEPLPQSALQRLEAIEAQVERTAHLIAEIQEALDANAAQLASQRHLLAELTARLDETAGEAAP